MKTYLDFSIHVVIAGPTFPEAFALTWDVALRAGKVYPDHTIKTE